MEVEKLIFRKWKGFLFHLYKKKNEDFQGAMGKKDNAFI